MGPPLKSERKDFQGFANMYIVFRPSQHTNDFIQATRKLAMYGPEPLPPPAPPVTGGMGKLQYTFNALEDGKATLQFVYR